MSTESKALTVNIQQAIQTISAQFPEEAKAIQAVVSRDIRALGTDEVFALRDKDGEIRAFKQGLTLSADNGGLVQPVPGGPHVVSAQGYEMWAEVTGSSVIFPKEVLVNGKWHPNPAEVRDPNNRRILAIYARAVAFRYSSKGIPQVVDRVTIFDTPSYRLIDLLGKAKKYPQAFRLYPAEMGKPEDAGTWAAYPFDESTNLWVNTSHDEALSWYAQILNREKKAIDFAQTFAARNALKHLSGIQRAPGSKWSFSVISWRPTGQNIVKWDAAQYIQLQERVGRLSDSCASDFEPGKTLAIECHTGTERVSDEEGFEEHERVEDLEDPASHVIDVPAEPEIVSSGPEIPPEPKPEPKPAAQSNPEEMKILRQYQEAKVQFRAEFEQACMALKLNPDSEHSVTQASMIVIQIGKIMDQA